jgi:signal peptidase II
MVAAPMRGGNRLKQAVYYCLIVLCVLCIDWAAKDRIVRTLPENGSISIFGDFLKFTLAYNTGITFGWFKGSVPAAAISGLKILVTILLIILFPFLPKIFLRAGNTVLPGICLSLIIGGSLGNTIDRLLDQKVTDFIDIGFSGHRWYVFNPADAFQVAGGLAMLSLILREEFKSRNETIPRNGART